MVGGAVWEISQRKDFLRWVLRMSRSSTENIYLSDKVFKIGKARVLERP